MKFRIATLAEAPDLRGPVEALAERVWPPFLLHGDIRNWSSLASRFSRFQAVALDRGPRVAGAAHAIPVPWNGDAGSLPPSLDAVVHLGNETRDAGAAPSALCALAAMVAPEHRGRGLSRLLLETLIERGREAGLAWLLAPVRPTRKTRYPLIPMERYVTWREPDGTPFDPWIAVHAGMGAEILAVAERVFSVEGTVAEWEGWTGLRFPESGPYVVKGALEPVMIDVGEDRGIYREHNLWMRHPIPGRAPER